MGGKRDTFQLKKCDDTHQHTGDDGLSMLPDDILVGILSTLPLKEAARTSILSPRWENLWKHTLHLNFDAYTALCRIAKHLNDTKIRDVERAKYINWVNKVLRSYKGFALKELRICFDLDKSSAQNAINHWLRFAFERRVERLELDLSIRGDFRRWDNACTWPMKKFKYLKALSLKSVDLTDQDIDVFLRSCPLLEHLAIDHATKISNINICGALALKHLEIIYCLDMKSLKISAPNLVSLRVTNAVSLLLDNVPKLVVVHVNTVGEKLQKLVPALRCCLSQLEILTLELHLTEGFVEELCKINFPVLAKLKKLEMHCFASGDKSMIGLTSLMRAAPYIQEFFIRIKWSKLLRTARNYVKNDVHSPHQHLKVVKFLGYYGRASDVELVRYLVDNSVALETLIIDPRFQTDFLHAPLDPDKIDGLVEQGEQTATVSPDEFEGLDAVRTARNFAKQQLQGQMPQHIELLIL